MSTAATKKAPAAILVTPALAKRILDEGYGPGAWHGNDMKAALADVTPKLAYWRPAPGRHNIAEIAIHALAIEPAQQDLDPRLRDLHHNRKHGPAAYYGQPHGAASDEP